MKKFFSFDKSLFSYTTSLGTISLFSLMLPMLFESVMNNVQSTVNMAVLSGYSEASVAAVGATSTVISLVTLLGTVVASGATVVISNRIGAEDIRSAQELSFTAIAVNVITSLLVSPLLVIFAPGIASFLNLEGVVYSEAVTYLRIRMVFMIFTIVTSAVLALLKCYGYPKYTFIVGLLVNIINLLLNIFVIKFPEYSPVTGVEGVAFSSCIAGLVGLIVAAFFLKKTGIKLKLPNGFKNFLHHTKAVLRIGVPSGVSSASFTLSRMVTTSFIALLSSQAISANLYFTNILCYVYLIGISMGNANALLVGRCYGAGDFERADKMNAQLVKLTVVINLTVSLLVLAFRRPLLGMFTDDQWTMKIALGVFAVDIIVEQARAVSHVYEYALRAVGDVVYSMVVLIISCWVFSIGLAYFLAIHCGLGVVGCFIGLAVDETVRAVVTFLRWKSGKWKTTISLK